MTVLLLSMITVAAAQAPVINAVVEHRTVSAVLSREVQSIAQQGRTVWVGYRVPLVRSPGERLTSSGTCCGRCRLEPPTDLTVLARVDRGGVIEIRPEPVDCDIDASGMPLVWLDDVRPEDSVAWLKAFVLDSAGASTRTADRALTAIALHASAAAPPVLVEVARVGPTAQLKGRALVWLGQSRDPRAAEFFASILLK